MLFSWCTTAFARWPVGLQGVPPAPRAHSSAWHLIPPVCSAHLPSVRSLKRSPGPAEINRWIFALWQKAGWCSARQRASLTWTLQLWQCLMSAEADLDLHSSLVRMWFKCQVQLLPDCAGGREQLISQQLACTQMFPSPLPWKVQGK